MESAKSWLSTLKSELISGKIADLLPKSLVGKLLLCGTVLAGGHGLWYTLVYFRRAVQRPRLSYQHNAKYVSPQHVRYLPVLAELPRDSHNVWAHRNEALVRACSILTEKYWPRCVQLTLQNFLSPFCATLHV